MDELLELEQVVYGEQTEREFPILENSFVKFLFPLVAGILFAYYSHLELPFWSYVVVVSLTGLILVFRYFGRMFQTFAVYLTLFFTGFFVLRLKTLPEYQFPSKPTKYVLLSLDEPRLKQKSVVFPARVLMFSSESKNWIKPLNNKVLVRLARTAQSEKIIYGDTILVFSSVRRVRNLGNPFEFDYKSFLARRGIYHTLYAKSGRFEVIGHGGGSPVLFYSHFFRQKLLDLFKKYRLPDELFGVAAALTLGYRQALDRQTQMSFARTGAMHVLAVSGLHVGIVFLVLMFLLKPVFSSKLKVVALFLIVFVLWAFAFLTGLSPSVRRAAFMFSLMAIAKIIRRRSNVYNVLAASAFFMLMLFPFDLFEVGFWLSYFAVISIVFFQPVFYRFLFFKNKIFDWVWQLFSVSIAAQIGTMPMGLYFFHQFPNYFLLTNLLAIPLASFALYSALLLFAFQFFAPLAKLFMFVFKSSIWLLYHGIKIIDSLPYATTTGIYISFVQMLLIYALIVLLTVFFMQKYKFMLHLSVVVLILFFSLKIFQSYRLTHPSRIIFYNIPRHNLIVSLVPKHAFVFADSDLVSDAHRLNYFIKPYLKRAKIRKIKVYPLENLSFTVDSLLFARKFFFWTGSLRFYLTTESKMFDYKAKRKLFLNYILVANNVYMAIRDLPQLFDFKAAIFLSSNHDFKIKHWLKQANKEKVSVYRADSCAVVILLPDKAVYWH